MERRGFITLFGGAAIRRPLIARAQQMGAPAIGFSIADAPIPFAHVANGFPQGPIKAGRRNTEGGLS
jgi:hypothetical protein